jgi:hypothetical protein
MSNLDTGEPIKLHRVQVREIARSGIEPAQKVSTGTDGLSDRSHRLAHFSNPSQSGSVGLNEIVHAVRRAAGTPPWTLFS